MRISSLIKLLIGSLLLWSPLCFGQSTYYKWLDKDGKVHFSNVPPGDVRGATPLDMRDRPDDLRSTSVRNVDEVGYELTVLMNQATILIQSGGNSTANKVELRSISSQLVERLKEYELRASLARAAETNSINRKL